MKVFALAVLLLWSLAVRAADYFEWDNPTTLFDARKRNYNVVQVEWRSVDNVFDYCSQLNISRGYGPLTNRNIKACGTQDGNKCLIVTRHFASQHNLGHELRHCFQGRWHGNKVN
jgi:hypothetical protein